MRERELLIMKFGGSSVENGAKYAHAANIIRNYSQDYDLVVVVSAMYGVTNRLLEIIDDITSERVNYLQRSHLEAASLLGLDERPLAESFDRFRQDLFHFSQLPESQQSDRDNIASYGERWSPLLLSGSLDGLGVPCQPIDPSFVIATDNVYGNAKADLELSQQRSRNMLLPLSRQGIIPIVGGFFGLSEEGKIAVVGRDGSDYSAAILAYGLNARRLILWKEVDGIYSADPKKDPSAIFYPYTNYDHAESLVIHHGAKIIHQEALGLLKIKNIPLEIKNFNKPELSGSLISESNFERR